MILSEGSENTWRETSESLSLVMVRDTSEDQMDDSETELAVWRTQRDAQ